MTEKISPNEICDRSISLRYQGVTGFESCARVCQIIGGRLPLLVNSSQYFLINSSFNRGHGSLRLWVSITDELEEGVWRDYYSGDLVSNPPWEEGQNDNFGKDQNCAAQYTPYALYDDSCIGRHACFCEFKTNPLIYLRGLCVDSFISPGIYAAHKRDMDNITLKFVDVFGSSLIEFDDQTLKWTLKAGNTSGSSEATEVLSKQNWNIQRDQCNKGQSHSIQLKLTSCDKDGEFTCDDGQCIMMEQRCDRKLNCRDKSDEIGCGNVLFGKSYNKEVPPSSPLGWSSPLNVSISINLLQVVDIKEEENSIDFQFGITLEWVDSRLTYLNLKKSSFLNALQSQLLEQVWLPLVIYDNTYQKETTRLGEYGNGEWITSVTVVRKGNFTRSGLEEVDEAEIFKGRENLLQMNQTYTHEFQCAYDLSDYPFDTQVMGI